MLAALDKFQEEEARKGKTGKKQNVPTLPDLGWEVKIATLLVLFINCSVGADFQGIA